MTNTEAIRILRNAAWLIVASFPSLADSATDLLGGRVMDNQEAIDILGHYDVSNIHFYTTDGEEIPFTEWSDAIEMAISALHEKDSLIARLKAEAIKRNVQYMKSGDRYLIGFVDGMRLARSIVDGSIDEPKYVYPSEGMSDD